MRFLKKSLTINSVTLNIFSNTDKFTESENCHEGQDNYHCLFVKIFQRIERNTWRLQVCAMSCAQVMEED